MSTHAAVTADEAGDRLAIREQIDAYAHCADRRLPEHQADLYVDGGRTLVYQGPGSEPAQVLSSRDEHVEGFRTLSRYAMTTHFNGQCTVTLDGDSATGETYCLAHHILENEHDRSLIVLAIR